MLLSRSLLPKTQSMLRMHSISQPKWWKTILYKMKVTLTVNKSISENAAFYYEQAKRAKKKIVGAKESIKKTEKEIEKLKTTKKYEIKKQKEKTKEQKVKREWYEKFHWFTSSDGFLCVGGRDATSNEIIVKKHVEKNDLVFHTEMPGSPFFVIKADNEIPKQTKEETAIATASYSKAWKLGLGTAEVFSFTKEQITKAPKKGSFFVHGKRESYNVELKLAIGIKEDKIIGGPLSAIKKQTNKFLVITPGHEKSSDIAKKIQHKLSGSLEDIQRFIPSGKSSLVK